MRLQVVNCPCDNPDSHRKWRTADGRETPSFFSLTQGNSQLNDLEKSGEFTADEIADARTELASCGLPAEPSDNTEEELVVFASSLIVSMPAQRREWFIRLETERGIVSAKSADRIRELLKDEKATLEAADVEDVVCFLACTAVEDREQAIGRGLITGVMSFEMAGRVRDKLKDVPVRRDRKSANEAVEAGNRMTERVLYRSGFGGVEVIEVIEVVVDGPGSRRRSAPWN